MRTVEWHNGTVVMIDQRLLPNEYKVVSFDDVPGVATSIREMYVRGAPAAFGVALAARNSRAQDAAALRADLEVAADQLRVTRPTAVSLF